MFRFRAHQLSSLAVFFDERCICELACHSDCRLHKTIQEERVSWAAFHQLGNAIDRLHSQSISPPPVVFISLLQVSCTASRWSPLTPGWTTAPRIIALKFYLHLLAVDDICLASWWRTVKPELSTNLIGNRKVVVARGYSQNIIGTLNLALLIKLNCVTDSPCNFNGFCDAAVCLGVRM